MEEYSNEANILTAVEKIIKLILQKRIIEVTQGANYRRTPKLQRKCGKYAINKIQDTKDTEYKSAYR